MVECLKNSGYNIGEEKYLIGHKYKGELAFEVAVNQGILERLSKTGRVGFILPKNITQAHVRQIDAVKHFIYEKQIDVVKDLYFTYLYNCYSWRGRKYIWTKRDFDESVRSVLRLQQKLGFVKREFEKQAEIFKMYSRAINDLMSQIQDERIEVHLEEFINNTSKVQRELSDFLGREIDTSIVSENGTWQKTGKAN